MGSSANKNPSYGEQHDIVIPQGATWREQFEYADVVYDDNFTPPKIVSKTPVDISSYTPKGQVRKLPQADSPVLATMSFVTVNANLGVIIAQINAAQTLPLDTDGVYDIVLVGAGVNPEVIRLANGRALLSRAVTATS